MAYRAIHDTVPYSESLANVSDFAERLYWRMLATSDSWGRLPGSPAKIKARCIPLLNKGLPAIAGVLRELAEEKRILLYSEPPDVSYLLVQILDFEENQPAGFVRRRGSSKYPEPSKGWFAGESIAPGLLPEYSRTTLAQKEKENKTKKEASPPKKDDLQAVYEHWRKARGRTDVRYSRISEARRQKIATRLREFDAAELIRAIDGVANDPWEERLQHDDLITIFRSREQVERFLEFADSPPRKAGGLSAQDIFDLDLGGDDDDEQASANANGHALRSLPAAKG